MKTGIAIAGGLAAVAIIAVGVYMVDIDQTQDARLPDVDVTVEGGQMPKFDAEVGSVKVTEEEVTMEVPDVDVTMEETTVTVPGLKIEPPKEDG